MWTVLVVVVHFCQQISSIGQHRFFLTDKYVTVQMDADKQILSLVLYLHLVASGIYRGTIDLQQALSSFTQQEAILENNITKQRALLLKEFTLSQKQTF